MERTVFCVCKSSYQDEKYGEHRRIWTPVGKASRNQVIEKVRCTVCGFVHPAPVGKKRETVK